MPYITIKLSNKIDNTSFQVGDTLYCVEPDDMNTIGGFRTSNSVREVGEVQLIINRNIVVFTNSQYTPPVGSYTMFGKNTHINNTSLMGYYLHANFVNNSVKEANLFSVGSEIAPSSK